jgi:hypothetical protein
MARLLLSLWTVSLRRFEQLEGDEAEPKAVPWRVIYLPAELSVHHASPLDEPSNMRFC